jgi:primase-polymerase (primpol)-like protein
LLEEMMKVLSSNKINYNEPTLVNTNIPADLKQRDQWVVWRYEKRGGKVTKPPINALTGGLASVSDRNTWTSFHKAVDAYTNNGYKGIGFVLSKSDPYFGIDLDGCIDPATGEVNDEDRSIIERLDTYTEISPSGAGVHIIGEGRIPLGGNRRGRREFYDTDRYLTITGVRFQNSPLTIEPRQKEIEEVHAQVFDPGKRSADGVSSTSDEQLLDRAFKAANGDKFQQLWNGNWQDEYPSQSEADLALCSMLAFWTGNDLVQIDKLFRKSGLMRAKWERQDYRQRTIQAAITGTAETWWPHRTRVDVEEESNTFRKLRTSLLSLWIKGWQDQPSG